MNELKQIIESVILKEIQQDDGVSDNSYVLEPISIETVLKGDGIAEETATNYQLDFFFRRKGELLAKAHELHEALGKYQMSDFSFMWEDMARMWRATVTITTI